MADLPMPPKRVTVQRAPQPPPQMESDEDDDEPLETHMDEPKKMVPAAPATEKVSRFVQKYRSDPAFREARQAAARARYHRKKAEQLAKREELERNPPPPPPQPLPLVVDQTVAEVLRVVNKEASKRRKLKGMVKALMGSDLPEQAPEQISDPVPEPPPEPEQLRPATVERTPTPPLGRSQSADPPARPVTRAQISVFGGPPQRRR